MPTHYRGNPQERQALDAHIKLMRAAESVTARLEPLMRAAHLTVGQFGTLEALLHLGTEQATLARLCRQLGRGRRDARGKETDNGVTAHSLRLAPAL
jgi:hypothetical protein